MPILANSRHERFAQEVAKGASATAAYAKAGYEATGAAIGINAGRLLKNAKVRARIDEILAAGARRAEVSVERVLREYARIGFADIRKAVKWRSLITEAGEDEDGVPLTRAANEVALVGSEEIDEDTALAIAEIAQTKDGALKVKLHSKLGALDSMARHLGMFNDSLNVNASISVEDMRAAARAFDDELARVAPDGEAPPVH